MVEISNGWSRFISKWNAPTCLLYCHSVNCTHFLDRAVLTSGDCLGVRILASYLCKRGKCIPEHGSQGAFAYPFPLEIPSYRSFVDSLRSDKKTVRALEFALLSMRFKVPSHMTFHPKSNPTGTSCTICERTEEQFGLDLLPVNRWTIWLILGLGRNDGQKLLGHVTMTRSGFVGGQIRFDLVRILVSSRNGNNNTLKFLPSDKT